MKLISLNVWGGRAYQELAKFLERKKDTIDIFCFQEVLDIFSLNNYKRLLLEQITNLNLCRNCKWYLKCRGACAFDRLLYQNYYKLENFTQCSTYKIYKHIYSRIKDQISELFM